jgi:hypothetical protein
MTDVKIKTVDTSDKKFDEVETLVRKSYPKSCIVYIKEITNEYLEKKYEEYKKTMNENPTELLAFHGTKPDAVKAIIYDGFREEYIKVAAYGFGHYFAKNCSYSQGYATDDIDGISTVFICKIALGKCKTGRSFEKITPDYDNFVDNLKKPSIYVVTNNHGVIPKYEVGFYKKAKFD